MLAPVVWRAHNRIMSDEFSEFVSRLTDNARTSLQHADAISRGYGSAYIGTEHLLLGVLSQGTSVGAKVLADAGVTLDRAELALNLTPRTMMVSAGMRGLSETAKLTLKMSWEIAQEFNQDYLGTEHLLYSILTQKNARATVLLRDMSVDIQSVVNELEEYFDRQESSADAEFMAHVSEAKKRKKKSGALDVFGTDL